MFPFFTSPWPVAVDYSGKKRGLTVPRLVVDGFFAVPRARFGCPDFDLAGIDVDRTVLVTPFPHEAMGLTAVAASPQDCISPPPFADDPHGLQLTSRLLLSTQTLSREALTDLYDQGWKDAEEWCYREQKREELSTKDERNGAIVQMVTEPSKSGGWWWWEKWN